MAEKGVFNKITPWGIKNQILGETLLDILSKKMINKCSSYWRKVCLYQVFKKSVNNGEL